MAKSLQNLITTCKIVTGKGQEHLCQGKYFLGGRRRCTQAVSDISFNALKSLDDMYLQDQVFIYRTALETQFIVIIKKINNDPVSILIDTLKNMNETEGKKHNVHLKYFLMASVDML